MDAPEREIEGSEASFLGKDFVKTSIKRVLLFFSRRRDRSPA